MQLSFHEKEQIFHELAQLNHGGLSLARSLDVLARSRSGRISSRIRLLQSALEAESNARDAFRRASFTPSDVAIVEAGELTGNLQHSYDHLCTYYAQLDKVRGMLISKSIYPLVILHLGAVLLALPPAVLEGSVEVFWKNALPILGGFYLVLLVLGIGWRFLYRGMAMSATWARLAGAIPFIGRALKDWSAWKFSMVFSLYVKSGGGVFRGLEAAGSASGDAQLAGTVTRAISAMQEGAGLADALRNNGRLPEVLERGLEVGEHTGRLDEEIGRAAEILKTRTLARLDAFARYAPTVLYITIVALMGYRIIVTAMNTMGTVNSLFE